MSILIINLSNIPHITTKPFIYVCMYLFLHRSPPYNRGEFVLLLQSNRL